MEKQELISLIPSSIQYWWNWLISGDLSLLVLIPVVFGISLLYCVHLHDDILE